jgi:hypothetical protein
VSGTIPIAELVDVCERMAATNRLLFETLGAWVADEPDPATQREFATMAHRHAWHADLWSERRPKIPVEATAASSLDRAAVGADRVEWYERAVEGLRTQLAALAARVDPTLDPATLRVITLVANDLP